MNTLSFVFKYWKKHFKLFSKSKLSQIVVLISMGLLILHFNSSSRFYTQLLINANSPDFSVVSYLPYSKFNGYLSFIDSLPEKAEISSVLYYDSHDLTFINNQSLFASYNVSNSIKILAINEEFFLRNGISKNVYLSENIGNYAVNNNISSINIVYSSIGGSLSYNFTNFSTVSFHSLVQWFAEFGIYPINSETEYIVLPFSMYVLFLTSNNKLSQDAVFSFTCFVYMNKNQRISSLDELMEFTNATQLSIEQYLANFTSENIKYSIQSLFFLRIVCYQKQLHNNMNIMFLITIVLISLASPLHYVSFREIDKQVQRIFPIFSAKGMTLSRFRAMLLLIELLYSFVIMIIFSVVFSVVNLLSVNTLSILYISTFSLLSLIDLVVIAFWIQKIPYEQKKVLKLKRSKKYAIVQKIIRLMFELAFFLGCIAFIFFLAVFSQKMELFILAIPIMLYEIIYGIKALVPFLIDGAYFLSSVISVKIFGDISKIFVKSLKIAKKRSIHWVFIIGVIILYSFTSTFVLNYKSALSNSSQNTIGGDITVENLMMQDYLKIAKKENIMESLPIVEIEITLRTDESEPLHIYFLHIWKLKRFLHFNGLDKDTINNIITFFDSFGYNNNGLVISKASAKFFGLNNDSELTFMPSKTKYEDLFMPPRPQQLNLTIVRILDYLPYFSEKNEFWGIASTFSLNSYSINLDYTSILMLDLKNNSNVDNYAQFLQSEYPYASVSYYKKLEKEQIMLFQMANYESLVLLALGSLLLFMEKSIDYQRLISILYSRGQKLYKTKLAMSINQFVLNVLVIVSSLSVGTLISAGILGLYYKVVERVYPILVPWTNLLIVLLILIVNCFCIFLIQNKKMKVKKYETNING